MKDLVKAAAGPVAGAVILTGILFTWVASGAASTLTKVRIQVTLAAVPKRAFTAAAADARHTAATYLTIRNLTGSADELVAVRSPDAEKVTLTQRALDGTTTAVRDLVVPAHGTLTLSPLAEDAVLRNPAPFEDKATVPLTLVFRDAGQITIDAPVTAPGTPLPRHPTYDIT